MSHTPGPWEAQIEKDTRLKIVGPEGWLGVAQAFGDDFKEAQANARLIAAAPELLEACQIAVVLLRRYIEDHILGDALPPEEHPEFPISQKYLKVVNAIAKATEFPPEIQPPYQDDTFESEMLDGELESALSMEG